MATQTGERMRHIWLLLLMVIACATAAKAAPTSIRCDGKYQQQQQPYFVTYELNTNHFVFEIPGGNMLPGEIISQSDERLDFSLRADGGRILLSFDRKRNVMTWPGMPAHELGRASLRHACTEVAGRTMLSAFRQPEQFDPKRLDPVDVFSLTCPGPHGGQYFVTLDRSTRTVVLEGEASAETMSGTIAGVDEGSIRFGVAGRSGRFELLWHERKRTLIWIGVADNPARPTISHECVVTGPRSLMASYADLARWRKM